MGEGMTMTTDNYARMLAGEFYNGADGELHAMQAPAAAMVERINAIPNSRLAERRVLLAELLGSMHPEAMVQSPFSVEYGKHIHRGDCFVNNDCIFLDGAEIRIGDLTMVGPRVQFLTAGHPVRARDRVSRDPATGAITGVVNLNKPITIGRECWIGAGTIIVAGVTIGDRTTIGAGSVVTKSIPPDVLAVGNPCRVVRQLD
jgi:maltose O-acetyltransferase